MSTEHQALLVMDIQQGIVDRTVHDPEYVARVSRAIRKARDAGIQVIYVRVAFRAGHPELSPRNRLFAGMSNLDQLTDTHAASQILPAIAPQPGDITVTKRRVSAFAGSDLEVVMRAREITTIVVAGIATSGVVLSTVREAADRDYAIVVLSDCCADADGEVHRVLMEKVFPRQAVVVAEAEWQPQRPDPGSVGPAVS